MSDKQPMQAAGEGSRGQAESKDGVNDARGKDGGGESGGGAYPNAKTGKKPEGGGFFGHGGQTDDAYSGPDGSDANAVTKE